MAEQKPRGVVSVACRADVDGAMVRAAVVAP